VPTAWCCVEASLLDATGAAVRTAPAVLDPGSAPEIRRATAVLESADLPPGAYTLLLEARGDKTPVVRRAVAVNLQPPTRSNPAAPASAASVIAQGPMSRHVPGSTHVIMSLAEWKAFWALLPTRQPAPDIDFARVTVLAVVGGAGDGVPQIDRVSGGGGVTVVRWRAPAGVTISNSGPVDAPFVAVGVVDRQLGTVRFERMPAR